MVVSLFIFISRPYFSHTFLMIQKCRKQYAAEYQIWQIQNRPDTRRGAPAMAILIDDEDDKFNPHLQRALDAFQDIFDADMADCEDYKRKQRRLDAVFYRKLQSWMGYDMREEQMNLLDAAKSEDLGFSDILDEPAHVEAEFQALRGQLKARRTEEFRRVWDPWHTDLYRTIWFYGYEGSLTEPPCTGESNTRYQKRFDCDVLSIFA